MMAAGHGYRAAGGQGTMRTAGADRDRATGIPGTAYSEGRPSTDEYDDRLPGAVSARTHAGPDHVLTGPPAAQPAGPGPAAPARAARPARTSGLAIASLARGLAQFALGPLAAIAAIVPGPMARSQIKRSGEQGAALARAGLVPGWGAVIPGLVVIAAGLATAAATHGAMPMR